MQALSGDLQTKAQKILKELMDFCNTELGFSIPGISSDNEGQPHFRIFFEYDDVCGFQLQVKLYTTEEQCAALGMSAMVGMLENQRPKAYLLEAVYADTYAEQIGNIVGSVQEKCTGCAVSVTEKRTVMYLKAVDVDYKNPDILVLAKCMNDLLNDVKATFPELLQCWDFDRALE